MDDGFLNLRQHGDQVVMKQQKLPSCMKSSYIAKQQQASSHVGLSV